MKKILYMLLLLIAAVGLTACNTEQSGQQGEPDKDKAVEKKEDEKPEVEQPAEEAGEKDDSATDDPVKEDAAAEQPQGENNGKTDVPADKPAQTGDVKENEQAAADKTSPAKEQSKVYGNEAFKDVVVNSSGNTFIVTGKAQVFEGVFQYRLSANGAVVKEDKYETEGAPAWGDFKITIGKDSISGNEANLKLFVLSAKDGSEIDVLDILLKK